MDNNEKDQSVYEIGYLIIGSLPAEKVPAETEALKKIISDAGATIIGEEMPHEQDLAYEIRVKEVSGSYQKHKKAYFGWIKFEIDSGLVEGIKKSIETHPSVLRMILIKTVRENTYLGKRAAAMLVKPLVASKEKLDYKIDYKKEVVPASIEEMDKSIEEMVREVS